MTGLFGAFLLTITSLVSVMNPVAALPVFAALTESMAAPQRARIAWRTALAVLAVSAASALVGRIVLQVLGISLPALQVAGGVVVGAAGLTMLSGAAPGLRDEEHEESGRREDPSVVPLAIPLISGPGAIGVLVGISSREAALLPILGVVAGCVVMAALVLLVLRFGDPLVLRLGTTGIGVLTRLFGLAVLAVAAELVARGALQLLPGLQ